VAPSEAAGAEVLGPAAAEVEVEVRRLAVADGEASRSARHRVAAYAP